MRKSLLLLTIFLSLLLIAFSSCYIIDLPDTGTVQETQVPPEDLEVNEVPGNQEEQEEINEGKPARVFLDTSLPLELRRSIFEFVLDDGSMVISDAKEADISMVTQNYNKSSKNIYLYAIVRDFFTLEDEVSWQDLRSFWKGDTDSMLDPEDTSTVQSMCLKEETLLSLEKVLGKCRSENINILQETKDIVERLNENRKDFAIVPFEEIVKEYKVLKIDGIDIFDKDLVLEDYPLAISAVKEITKTSQVSDNTDLMDDFYFSNREKDKIVTINMTGVTALTRGTANRMDEYGATYPAEKVADILLDSDITHISNEVSFVEDCTGYKKGSLLFCSKPEYMELLDYIDVDIVELTGNHLNDYGNDWFLYTLDYYDDEGIPYYGGGRDLESAHSPFIIEVGGTGFAFLGANSFGPASNWAQEERAGSARINMWDEVQMEEDFLKIEGLIKDLKEKGYVVIFTFQYMETYDYMPVQKQIIDFRRVIDMGADIVSGSQAHQPQGMEFYNDGFINYGLGNLFFDQMQNLGVRQGVIARHVFYDGEHINTLLITTMLEDYSQPRLTTEEERIQLLEFLYSGSIY